MRRSILSALAAAILVVLVMTVGASANLPGSTFEGNDGNLVVNTPGNADWENAPNLSAAADLTSGPADNSFGQGTQENDVNVTVVSGSIPNSKADLARFGVAGETVGSNVFLYLAWTRENDAGSVNYDFEINQAAQPDLTTPGAKTLNRTVGDLNISYAFQGNNLTPELSFRAWNGTSWGAEQPLAGCSEGQGNSATVSDILTSPAVNRTQGRFGEAAINLTCAGIVPPGSCEPFSSAFIKSRASQSFQSEIKDFIAPVELQFNNCGKLTVIKHTIPGGLNQDFGYTTTGGLVPANFTLNDAGTDTQVFDALQPGNYSVTEGADPTGFAFDSVSCTGGGTTINGKTVDVTITANADIVCTYLNKQQLGAIKVTKTTKIPGLVGPQPQAGVNFTVNGVTKATDANGEACFDGLVFGSYDVTETVPAGYAADGPTTKSVLVDTNTSCAASPYDGETVGFSNSPLTDVTISVDSKADGGTASTVTCDDPSLGFTTGANGDGSDTSDVVAGSKTINCTIVIDP
jgi:hypothetical protein